MRRARVVRADRRACRRPRARARPPPRATTTTPTRRAAAACCAASCSTAPARGARAARPECGARAHRAVLSDWRGSARRRRRARRRAPPARAGGRVPRVRDAVPLGRPRARGARRRRAPPTPRTAPPSAVANGAASDAACGASEDGDVRAPPGAEAPPTPPTPPHPRRRRARAPSASASTGARARARPRAPPEPPTPPQFSLASLAPDETAVVAPWQPWEDGAREEPRVPTPEGGGASSPPFSSTSDPKVRWLLLCRAATGRRLNVRLTRGKTPPRFFPTGGFAFVQR